MGDRFVGEIDDRVPLLHYVDRRFEAVDQSTKLALAVIDERFAALTQLKDDVRELRQSSARIEGRAIKGAVILSGVGVGLSLIITAISLVRHW